MAYAAPRLRVTLSAPVRKFGGAKVRSDRHVSVWDGRSARWGEIPFPFAPISPIRAHLPRKGKTKGLAGRHPGLCRHTQRIGDPDVDHC